MNILYYLKTQGEKDFGKAPLDDIDLFAFAELSYVNFDLICPSLGQEQAPIAFKDLEIKDMDALTYGSVDAKNNAKLINIMRKSPRYGDVRIGLCQRIFDEQNPNQFFALTFFLPNGETIISYRGTDITLIGWKEDFMMTFSDAIPSQIQALDYLSKVHALGYKKLSLTGHSKGGNLALYSLLMAKENIAKDVSRAVSFDGPGFKDGMKAFPSFESLSPKIAQYLTHRDIVGLVFGHTKEPIIVYSNGLLLGGHDPFYWQIDPKTKYFKTEKGLTASSKRSLKVLTTWLNSVPEKDRPLLSGAIFDVFHNCSTVYDLLKFAGKDLVNSKKVLSKYSKEEQAIIKKHLLSLVTTLLSPNKKVQNQ